MKSKQTKINRELSRTNGIDERLIYIHEKQEGYGRKGIYVEFNHYHFGNIEKLYLGSVFPNIREQFENDYDTLTKIVIDNYYDEICNYLENIEIEDNE